MSQESFADQGAPALTGPCAWCSTPTKLKLQIRAGSNKGAKSLKLPYDVWCCETHQRSIALRGDA